MATDRARSTTTPALSRRRMLRRWFRWGIVGGATLASAGVLSAFARTAKGKRTLDAVVQWWQGYDRKPAASQLEKEFARVDAWVKAELDAAESDARALVAKRYRNANAAQRAVLEHCGLTPETAVYGRGLNVTNVGVLPGKLFAKATGELAYRFQPRQGGTWYTVNNPFSGVGHDYSYFAYLAGACPLFPEGLERFQSSTGVAFDDYRLKNRPHRTNSWGLRGPEPNPDAAARVAFVGDSFVHGLCVADGDDPPAQLEKCLSEKLRTTVSVVNAAGTGWGPKDYRAILEEVVGARGFAPQVAVIGVCELNDFGSYEALDRRERAHAQRDRDLYLHSQIHLARALDYCVDSGVVPVVTFAPDIELFLTPKRHRPSGLMEAFEVCRTGFRRAHQPDLLCDPIPAFVAERNRQAAAAGVHSLRHWGGEDESRIRKLQPLHLDEFGATVSGDGRFRDMHTSAYGNLLWAKTLADHLAPLLAPGADLKALL